MSISRIGTYFVHLKCCAPCSAESIVNLKAVPSISLDAKERQIKFGTTALCNSNIDEYNKNILKIKEICADPYSTKYKDNK